MLKGERCEGGGDCVVLQMFVATQTTFAPTLRKFFFSFFFFFFSRAACVRQYIRRQCAVPQR